MGKPLDRCKDCIFYEQNPYTGIETCSRNYPPTDDFRMDCKIRLYKKGPWVSAYRKRSEWGMDLEKLFGKEIIDMSDKPLEEKIDRAKAFLNKYAKSVKSKGSTIVAGFANELPENYRQYPRLNLGIPSIDKFFAGGLPMGGLITCAGDASVGKTTFLLRIIAAAQKRGKLCLLADAEGTFDVHWAELQGVDVENLVVLQPGLPPDEDFTPTALEDYWNGIIAAANQGIFDLFGIDSLDAMIARGRMQSKKGKDRDLDDADVALKARVLSDAYPRVLGALRANAATIFQVAQLRTTGIGSVFVSQNISGGNARKYYDILTLNIRRGPKNAAPTEDNKPIGFQFIMDVKKSKVSGIVEGSSMSTMFFYGKGFDPVYELTVEAIEKGIIKKKGNTRVTFVDLSGNQHNINYGRPNRIAEYIVQNNLLDDLKTMVTGLVEEDDETPATGEDLVQQLTGGKDETN